MGIILRKKCEHDDLMAIEAVVLKHFWSDILKQEVLIQKFFEGGFDLGGHELFFLKNSSKFKKF